MACKMIAEVVRVDHWTVDRTGLLLGKSRKPPAN